MKNLTSCTLALVLCFNAAHAATGRFYIGANGMRSHWQANQRMEFKPGRVIGTAALNADHFKKEVHYKPEVLIGSELHNGTFYGAFEAWYSPSTFNMSNNRANPNLLYTTRVHQPVGGRIKLGLEKKSFAFYGIFGLSQSRNRTTTTYPAGSIYSAVPGPSLLNNRFTKTTMMRTLGFGLNYACKNNIIVSAEYLFNRSVNSHNLNGTTFPFLNPIGSQKNILRSDTLMLGVKYAFKPFTI